MTEEDHETKISEALEGLDGASIFNMIMLVADARDVDLIATLDEIIDSGWENACLDDDQTLIGDMIIDSQSDQQGALRSLREAVRLYNEALD